MQSLFHLHVLKAFSQVIADYELSPMVESEDLIYLVSAKTYALSISNDRYGINIWYLYLKSRDEILSYNILVEASRTRPRLDPSEGLTENPTSLDDQLGNYARMLVRDAPDALDGDMTWLGAVGQPVRHSPSASAKLHDCLQGALPRAISTRDK